MYLPTNIVLQGAVCDDVQHDRARVDLAAQHGVVNREISVHSSMRLQAQISERLKRAAGRPMPYERAPDATPRKD